MCAATLEDLVRGHYKGPEIGSCKEILRQICSALEHLHSLDIIHGNLKKSNILISFPSGKVAPCIKLCDFGFCLVTQTNLTGSSLSEEDKNQELQRVVISSEGWMAPDPELTTQSDIFPLACLFSFLLIEGHHPYGSDLIKRYSLILKKKPMLLKVEQLRHVGKGTVAFALIKLMVSAKPEERPTATQVLNSEFFQTESLNGARSITKPTLPEQKGK